MVRTVCLGDVPIGPEHPTLFLPEIGLYFGSDVGQARESIQAVKDAGCSVIKGEICHTADIVLDDGFLYHYQNHKGPQSKVYRDLIAELVLPMKTWYELWGMCHDLGMSSVISAYDPIAVDFVADVGGGCIKISTNNVVNVPLIRYAAKKGLPLMIDTGKASLEEVARAVDTARDAGCEDIIINHAPDGHPAAPKDHHLRIIETYERAFALPVGLADHHTDDAMVYAAAALGYGLVEKPCVPVPKETDVDAMWTMSLAEMPAVIRKMNACWEARGHTYRPTRFRPEDHSARMGLVTAHAVKAGDKVDAKSICHAWPCRGVSVYDWDIADGGTFTTDLEADQPVVWDHVQPHSKP